MLVIFKVSRRCPACCSGNENVHRQTDRRQFDDLSNVSFAGSPNQFKFAAHERTTVFKQKVRDVTKENRISFRMKCWTMSLKHKFFKIDWFLIGRCASTRQLLLVADSFARSQFCSFWCQFRPLQTKRSCVTHNTHYFVPEVYGTEEQWSDVSTATPSKAELSLSSCGYHAVTIGHDRLFTTNLLLCLQE